MNDSYSPLKRQVHMLGDMLGQTIKDDQGQACLDRIEDIRQLAKAARGGDRQRRDELLETLSSLSDDELLPVARAFSQFLNLANIAEQYHSVSRSQHQQDPIGQLLAKLGDAEKARLPQVLAELDIELVLTAHPTEVTRRTLIRKYAELNHCLHELENTALSHWEQQQCLNRLRQLIAQAWHTDEIRHSRPTPVDEAKWGFATVEHSLWQALPLFLRQLGDKLEAGCDLRLPVDWRPVRFASWMGGDRDGNPFVTAQVTERVMLLSRWTAADLYLRDLAPLISELSMTCCNDQVRALAGDAAEPYRQVLRGLRTRLHNTLAHIEARLKGETAEVGEYLWEDDELLTPVQALYDSLHQTGMDLIADGALKDLLQRIHCFGLTLVRLDIRQDAQRHQDAVAEIVAALELGDYHGWSEQQRQAFLLEELASKRPLLPRHWQPSPDVQEVLDTCAVIARQPKSALGTYVISMASRPSDVLAVALLLQEAGVDWPMPIAPLFETLDDLNNAADVIDSLLAIPWYRDYVGGRQEVMIGYSDSAKDAGVIAAAWAQYRAQEALVAIGRKEGIAIRLFHGRGGSIGRGGGPAHAGILSQPPGSVNAGLRVTEQGEMIRFKFGLPALAVNSLNLYTAAVLEARLLPPPPPQPQWRQVMDQLAEDACNCYRRIVREAPDFVPYFRAATPEQELGALPLGSRPTKRRPEGGVESLRAIPWIFAWTQNRLMLPAWLGSGEALRLAIERGQQDELESLYEHWPFFKARLDMLEMVYMKADTELAAYYEQRLVPNELWPLGKQLRALLREGIHTLLTLSKEDSLMDKEPWIQESIRLRNPYTDPLNILQAELLRRARQQAELPKPVERALMVTIAGIAAGMRNTG
ncbi:phosphoenolpyruvate carboxylase [Gallaecimonas sp. GXIMD4217]|uniref:phosphoenolpyruvate carboxylase n=1 Tax=Gallaecimonas sp. GXIMD4217 TaxID=3131927 RepID=UPI00311AE605